MNRIVQNSLYVFQVSFSPRVRSVKVYVVSEPSYRITSVSQNYGLGLVLYRIYEMVLLLEQHINRLSTLDVWYSAIEIIFLDDK